MQKYAVTEFTCKNPSRLRGAFVQKDKLHGRRKESHLTVFSGMGGRGGAAGGTAGVCTAEISGG